LAPLIQIDASHGHVFSLYLFFFFLAEMPVSSSSQVQKLSPSFPSFGFLATDLAERSGVTLLDSNMDQSVFFVLLPRFFHLDISNIRVLDPSNFLLPPLLSIICFGKIRPFQISPRSQFISFFSI